MGNMMKFDYYYGIEAEQFSFYRVPRLLIRVVKDVTTQSRKT